jgi:hypothetical protein
VFEPLKTRGLFVTAASIPLMHTLVHLFENPLNFFVDDIITSL